MTPTQPSPAAQDLRVGDTPGGGALAEHVERLEVHGAAEPRRIAWTADDDAGRVRHVGSQHPTVGRPRVGPPRHEPLLLDVARLLQVDEWSTRHLLAVEHGGRRARGDRSVEAREHDAMLTCAANLVNPPRP